MIPTTGTIYETLAESVRVFYCLSCMSIFQPLYPQHLTKKQSLF